MGSNFLQSGDTTNLTDGTAQINIQSAVLQNLLPNLPVHTTGSKLLTSGLIQISDCGFSVVSNSGLGVTGDIPIYNDGTGEILIDSGIPISSISGGPFLQLAGGTMSGSIDLGANELSDVFSISTSDTCVRFGDNCSASGASAIAIGGDATANFNGAISIGFSAISSDNYAVSIGGSSVCSNGSSIALAQSSNALGTNQVVLGAYTVAEVGANDSVIIGFNTSANNSNSVIIGSSATETGGNNCVIGKGSSAGAALNSMIGFNNLSTQSNASVIGNNNNCTGNNNIIIGSGNTGSSDSSFILGNNVANNISNSLLISNGSMVNIRSDSTCDLGATASNYFNNAYISGNLSGVNNSRAVDNIVSNGSTGNTGSVVVFSDRTGKIVKDGNVLLSNLATTSQLSSYLPLAGGTMIGGVNMLLNTLTVNNMSDDGTHGIVWGNSTVSSSSLGTIVIGDSSTLNALDGCILGRNSLADATQCTLLGIANIGYTAGIQGTCVGISNIVSGFAGICIGSSNQATAQNSISLGNGLINSTANSLLIGSAAGGQNLLNIRPQTNSTCDLGATASNYFNNAYLSGNLSGVNNSRAVDNILSNGSTGATGSILVFADGTGKVVKDSGIIATNFVTNGSTAVSGDIATFSGTSGNIITDSLALSRTSFQQSVYSMLTGAVGISNTLTQSTLLNTGKGSLTFPANSTTAGTQIRIQAMTQFTILNLSQLSFVVVNTVGPYSFGQSYTNSSGLTQSNNRAIHDISIWIKGDGTATIGWLINIQTGSVLQEGSSTTFWGTDVSNTLDFQAQWSVADPTNLVFQNYFAITRIF